MRLAKLTLSGFKSFADRTEFTFENDVTGIVGPNGCGKSNVVDAIRWVLGERSSKSLRGKEMIDVIFAGSTGRKPAGMASVTLSFDNPVLDESHPHIAQRTASERKGNLLEEAGADGSAATATDEIDGDGSSDLISRASRRALPIDTDVVEVERRLYRDGTSQYLINTKRARLRDIRELFLDTGVGADAYSIIEQGKVDAMLLANPQERRAIFEEAAGIAKYKARRIESQRKLERTETNLVGTRERLKSTERRLRIIKGQAAKARRFKQFDADLRALRMALAFDQYDDIRVRLDGLTSRLTDLEGVRSASQETLERLEGAKQQAELDRHELGGRVKEIDEARLEAEHAVRSARQRRQMAEHAAEDASRQAEIDGQRLGEAERRITDLGTAAEEQAETIAALGEQLAEAERELVKATSARASVLKEQAERQAELSERQGRSARVDRERASLEASATADERRTEALQEQLDALAGKAEALAAERGEQAESMRATREAIEERRARTERTASELAELDDRLASLSRDRRDVAQMVADLEQRHVRLDSRRATLQEMIDARAELGDAVRRVLEKRDAGEGFGGVVAPLADLIETDAEHAPAVEAALGSMLQGLVVESAMPDRAERAALEGRVTFLPLDGEDRPRLGPDASGLVPLLKHVRARDDDARVAGLLGRLLGDVYLADNIEDIGAGQWPADCPARARLVTPDGVVIDRAGVMTAGPTTAGEGGGLLQRRTELVQLRKELDWLDEELDSRRASLRGVDTEAADLNTRRTKVQTSLSEDQRQLVGEQTRLVRVSADLSRLERDAGTIEQDADQIRRRIEQIERDRAELLERASKLTALRDELNDTIGQLESRIAATHVEVELASERMTGAKVSVGRLAEQLASARRERDRIELAIEDAQRQHRNLVQHVEQASARQREHARAVREAGEQIERAAADAERLGGEAERLGDELAGAEARVLTIAEQVNAARDRARALERDWHSLEVARRELEVKRETIEQRTLEDLSIDLDAEYDEYRAVMAEGVDRIDPDESSAQIDVLREQIHKLGNVNLDAIEEETQLVERNENLVRQVADLDEARKKLVALIDHLNTVSRERFGETLTRIQEHFAGRDGMFRRLFGGGRAEIRLMPLVKDVDGKKVVSDDVDLLESGIEVIAKPPGKEPRSISQLSGGERTLTAVALLMAIFQSKPSCFCILDEVDAALDDANVERFCTMIRRFTSQSHFIVITHNKRTMMTVDQIFGVTMQERGVSKRVGVRLDEIDGRSSGKKQPDDEATDGNGSLRGALASMRRAEPTVVS